MHFCYRCARIEGYSTNAEIELVLDSDYQLEKFIKHTRPDRIYSFNSIFANPSTDVYRNYIVTGSMAGSVEIDECGRENFIWFAGSKVGATYKDGKLLYPDDSVKIVLPFDSQKIHAFPMSSTSLNLTKCEICGAPILE